MTSWSSRSRRKVGKPSHSVTSKLLVAEQGIRQLLDVGTGLPTAGNTHELAQRIAPACRIVYVDNDPMVLVHARALLTSTPEGMTDYLDADVRNPNKIIEGAGRTLDFTQPIALIMNGILGNIVDYDEARAIAAQLVSALPPGSYVVVNDGTNVIQREERDAATRMTVEAGAPYISRHPREIAAYLDGLELVERVWCPRRGGGPTSPASSLTRSTCSAESHESQTDDRTAVTRRGRCDGATRRRRGRC